MIGTTLGHYKLVDKLGHGGMGEVFRAQDTKLKREVALKVLPGDLAGDEERLQRFQREAESIAALNHPNIVTIYSVEEDDGTHFLTMELIEGRSLDELIPDQGMALDEIFRIATPLADALSSAHGKGIVHRDLKPANVMVTDEGRVKILDFGLAKLLSDPGIGEASEDMATEALTRDGHVLGTMPYMSPEQVQGKPLDARSDIFSLGVMLYEMATGSRPFRGETSADLISAIMRDNPESASQIKVDLPHHLGRIIRHCLEKNPNRRYQSALDVRNELEDLRREVESGIIHTESAAIPATAARGIPKWAIAAGLGVVALILALLGWQVLAPGSETPPATAPTEGASGTSAVADARPSVAVLYFDNLSGDAELDWLRNGLTDMLVTDLSQSPDLKVLSTDRLYQILTDLDKLDEPRTSFETVSAVAEKAEADTVILGSFAKLGDTIRVSYKIQEAGSGEILKAQSVDANAQNELFARVDDLSRDIRLSLELPAQPAAVADRDLSDVSTSSVEAYRLYVAAEELHFQMKEQEALDLYRQATEIDPEFAMALAKISTTSGNLGLAPQSLEYAERAMEHLDRLTEPERAYIEGRYYGNKLQTADKAIETYSRALENYPHITSLSNNLGIQYAELWMYDDAIRTQEQGIRYGDTFPGSHASLADAYFRIGDHERAYEVVDAYLDKVPENFSLRDTRVGGLMAEGRLEEAESWLTEAEAMRPNYFPFHFDRFNLSLLQEDWQAARKVADAFRDFPVPFAQAASLLMSTLVDTYRGELPDIPGRARQTIEGFPGGGPARAGVASGWAARLLEYGHPEQALELARQARTDGPGYTEDFQAHGTEVLAQQALGQERRADLLLEELEERVEKIPGPRWRNFARLTRGQLALMRGEADAAITELGAIEEAIPETIGDAMTVSFHLGSAFLEAGKPAEARRRFENVIGGHAARAWQPLLFIRSHYLLGQAEEQLGNVEAAKAAYGRFLDYWGEGDFDPERVEHARSFIASN